MTFVPVIPSFRPMIYLTFSADNDGVMIMIDSWQQDVINLHAFVFCLKGEHDGPFVC